MVIGISTKNMTARFPHVIAKELYNILDISILMNMLAFEPNFRANE